MVGHMSWSWQQLHVLQLTMVHRWQLAGVWIYFALAAISSAAAYHFWKEQWRHWNLLVQVWTECLQFYRRQLEVGNLEETAYRRQLAGTACRRQVIHWSRLAGTTHWRELQITAYWCLQFTTYRCASVVLIGAVVLTGGCLIWLRQRRWLTALGCAACCSSQVTA